MQATKMTNISKVSMDAYMKVYDETKLLYLEEDVSGVGLGAGLLW